MALFGSKESREEKEARKDAAILEKFGVPSLSDPEDMASVRKIAQELAGSGLMETGMKLSMAKPEFQLPISYQRAIMEQNFIIIRQLDRLTSLLENK